MQANFYLITLCLNFCEQNFHIPYILDAKRIRCFYVNIFTILFLCEDKDIGRFSNLHLCTFNAQPLLIFIIIIIVLLLLHYYHNYYYYYPFISGSSSSSSSIRTSSRIIIIIIISSSSINNISESIPVLTSICEHFMCFLLFYINALHHLF